MIKGFVCEFLTDGWVRVYFYNENRKRASQDIKISEFESIANVKFRADHTKVVKQEKGLFDDA